VKSPLHYCQPRAAVLIFALVVIALGGVLAAAWVGVMATRAIYGEQMITATKRRISLENSRMLATQYFLNNVLVGTSGDEVDVELTDGWGGFVLGEWDAAPLLGVSKSSGYNVFNPGGGDVYTVNFSVSLLELTAVVPWVFAAKSRSAFYGWDGLITGIPLLNPAISTEVSENLQVAHNSVIWRPNSPNSYELRTTSFQTPIVSLPSVTLTNISGNSVVQSNVAFPPVTTGPVPGGLGYYGTAATIANVDNPNSLGVKVLTGGHIVVNGLLETESDGIISDGAGEVMINLLEPGLNKIYIPGNVTTLRLVGQSSGAQAAIADTLPAILLVFAQDDGAMSFRNLEEIILEGFNARRLYLAIRKTNGTVVNIVPDSAGNPLNWRLGMTLENVPVSFTILGGSLQLAGGIRTDQSVLITGGLIRIIRDEDPRLLERFADRIAWLETYRP